MNKGVMISMLGNGHFEECETNTECQCHLTPDMFVKVPSVWIYNALSIQNWADISQKLCFTISPQCICRFQIWHNPEALRLSTNCVVDCCFQSCGVSALRRPITALDGLVDKIVPANRRSRLPNWPMRRLEGRKDTEGAGIHTERSRQEACMKPMCQI